MQYAFVALDNVIDVNHFDEVSEITFVRGNAAPFYFRLVTLTTECDDPLSHQLRYIPPTGTTVTMYFEHIDLSKCFNRAAVQPFPQDPSIWMINLMPCDIFQPNSMVASMLLPGQQAMRLLPISEVNQVSTGTRRFFA